MSHPKIPELPYFDKLKSAIAFIYFWRRWFPCGEDIVLYWMDHSGECRRFCLATGENSTESLQVYDGTISGQDFEDLHDRAVELGAMIARDSTRISTGHCDDVYVIELSTGKRNQFRIPGAHSPDDNINKLRKLIIGTDLQRFYREAR